MAEQLKLDDQPRRLPQLYRPAEGAGLPQLAGWSPGPEEESFSLRQYLEMLSRRRWLALAVTLTIVLLVAVQVLTTTPLYRATATLQIDPEFSNVMPFEDIGEPTGRLPSEAYLLTQVAKLQSRALAERVVDTLDLTSEPAFNQTLRRGFFLDRLVAAKRAVSKLFDFSPPASPAGEPGERSRNRLVSRFTGHLGASPVRSTRLIKVSFTAPEPELAARVANGAVDEFVRQNLESKYESIGKVTQFLERELTGLGSRIETSEAATRDFAREQNIVTLSERQEVNRKKLTDLIDSMTEAETELVAQRARYEAARRATIDNFPELLKDETIRSLEGRLGLLQGQLAALSARYGPAWPAVRELHQEIEAQRRQIAESMQKAIDKAVQEYQLLLGRHQQFQAAVEQQRAVVDDINDELLQFNMLQREVDTNKELYEGLLQRLSEAGVAAGLKSNDLRVVERAIRPSSIYAPNKTQALGLALVLGICLGFAAAVVAESIDRSLKTEEDVTRYLRLPALGVIPDLTGRNGSWRWGPFKRRQPSDASLPILDLGERATAQAEAWEAYRSLRTSVLLSHSSKPPQTILVTSAVPGEGKSTTVANMAIALAHTGARTLMLDLDLRKPSLAREFGANGAEGMSTFLSGNSDLSSRIQQTRYSNLFLVPAGPPAPNPAELIGSERMTSGLDLVREYFKYIVVDVPPSLNFTDALVLSPRVDGVILVVRAGRTPREAVRKVGEMFQMVGAKVLGVLVNHGEVERSAYGGYYRYYQRYRVPSSSEGAEPAGHG